MPIDVVSGEPKPASSYHIRTETTKVKGLLTGEGVRYLFTSFVSNFRNFAPVAIILVVMIGVGLAEAAGLIGALIRKLVGVSSKSSLTFIIVAARHPLEHRLRRRLPRADTTRGRRVPECRPSSAGGHGRGLRGRRSGLRRQCPDHAAGRVLTEITNDAAGAANASQHIDIAANLYFGIGSTIFVTIVLTIITTMFVEGRLGTWDASQGAGRPRGDGRA